MEGNFVVINVIILKYLRFKGKFYREIFLVLLVL